MNFVDVRSWKRKSRYFGMSCARESSSTSDDIQPIDPADFLFFLDCIPVPLEEREAVVAFILSHSGLDPTAQATLRASLLARMAALDDPKSD